jgi:hypothetical protein
MSETDKPGWEKYKAFQKALFEELQANYWGAIEWNGNDQADFKDALRTAWEKSQNP